MDDLERAFMLDALGRTERRRDSPEERLALEEHRGAVREVVLKYGYYADLQAFAELIDLYTEDVERVLSGSLREVVHGKDELRRVFAERSNTAVAAGGPVVLKRHHIDSDIIRMSDDGRSADVVALGTVVVLVDDKQSSHEDIYLFSLRREAATWRIARQVVVTENLHNPLLHGTAR